MHIQYRGLKLIQISGRPDEDNEAILRGDYLDKTSEEFIMPTRDEMLKQFIFPDWQKGDILVIAPQPLAHPKKEGETLVEMTREEVCETGDLSVLTVGEVYQDGTIIKKEKPQGVKIEWQYPNWVETATEEELQEKYFSLINKYKTEILETGYIYVDSSQVNHQQKCRDKDLALLGNAIAAHGDIVAMGKKDFKTSWSFNDDDVLEMELEELKVLRFRGAIFIQVLFNIEAQLKSQDRNINLTKQNFIDLINKNSDVKCWIE